MSCSEVREAAVATAQGGGVQDVAVAVAQGGGAQDVAVAAAQGGSVPDVQRKPRPEDRASFSSSRFRSRSP